MLTKKQVILKLTNGQHEADIEAFDSEDNSLLLTITAHDLDRLAYTVKYIDGVPIHCFKSSPADDFYINYTEGTL